MANHEHAYLICENKCLVEGIPKEDGVTKEELAESLAESLTGVLKIPTYVRITTNSYEVNLGIGESLVVYSDTINERDTTLNWRNVGNYLVLTASVFNWYTVLTEGKSLGVAKYNTVTLIIRVA